MDEHRLPPLNGVRSFAAAARHLSFTAAARELNVTQGAVSRSVQALEIELGVQLFDRAGRAIKLTSAGETYYLQIAEALGRIAAATRSLRRPDQSGVLSINLLPTFALRWLVPRLQRFQQKYPDILVDVSTGDGPVDFSTASADLALRYGRGRWPGAEATLLMTEEMGVFCAPMFLKRAPPLRSVRDLPAHRLLAHTTRPDAWLEYFKANDVARANLTHAPGFEHFFMLAEAAANGMGIALLPLYLAADEVVAGRLIQPLAATCKPAAAYYLLNAPGRGRVRKIQLFKRWLLGEVPTAKNSAD